MKFMIIVFFFLIHSNTFSQGNEPGLAENAVCHHLFGEYASQDDFQSKRALLKSSDASLLSKINPLIYLASGLLFVYQNIFSEQISSVCTYEISCSEMTKRSIARYGLFKGTFVGLHQLTNCSPSILHDHEDHVISDDDKIINSISNE